MWPHSVLMIEAGDSTEFDGWYRALTDCNYDDLRIPAKNDRVAVVPGLEEHLTFSTECAEEVVATLDIFMLCSHYRTCRYWAFMVVLRNAMCAAVRFEDYGMEAKLTVEYRLARLREMKSKAYVSTLCEAALA